MLLFRYSALTFNGHRIHYDRRYVTEVEGYPGLVVHGPLIATLLLDLLRRELPDARVSHFAFRALKPTYDVAPFRVCGPARRGRPDRPPLGRARRRRAGDGRDRHPRLAASRPPAAPETRRLPMLNEADEHQEIRDAVRHLCSQFPDEYFRKVDEQRAYPEAFVDALTEAGWLAAMIPRGVRRLRASA